MDRILKQFGKEKIEDVVKISTSFVDATVKLGLDPHKGNIKKNVERSIKRLCISTIHFESIQKIQLSRERYTKEKLEILVKECNTYKEILEKLDILNITNNYITLKRKLDDYKIDYSHLKCKEHIKANWIKEILEPIVKNSNNSKEILEKLGLRNAGNNRKTLNKYIEKYNLDISHFINKSYSNKKVLLENILVENSTYDRKNLKNRLYETGLKERKCEMCGQDENWNGKHMSLIIDHINGVHDDNRLENLRILCPNCNATLDTHCGKNINVNIRINKLKKKEELKLEKKKEFILSKRTVERPSYENLKNDIETIGYCGTGKKYGVLKNFI